LIEYKRIIESGFSDFELEFLEIFKFLDTFGELIEILEDQTFNRTFDLFDFFEVGENLGHAFTKEDKVSFTLERDGLEFSEGLYGILEMIDFFTGILFIFGFNVGNAQAVDMFEFSESANDEIFL